MQWLSSRQKPSVYILGESTKDSLRWSQVQQEAREILSGLNAGLLIGNGGTWYNHLPVTFSRNSEYNLLLVLPIKTQFLHSKFWGLKGTSLTQQHRLFSTIVQINSMREIQARIDSGAKISIGDISFIQVNYIIRIGDIKSPVPKGKVITINV